MMDALLEFFETAARLQNELRLCRMADGARQPVSSHSFMMSLMAVVLGPKVKDKLDMERVLKLCAVHDLPESLAHDVPFHKTAADAAAKARKHECESDAITRLSDMAGAPELTELWREYEDEKTGESKFVRMLDKLEVVLTVLFGRDLDYLDKVDDGVYWKIYYSDDFRARFDGDPFLSAIFGETRRRIGARIKSELGKNPEDFKER